MKTTLAGLVEGSGQGALFVDGDWVESKDQDPDGDVRLTQLADVGDGAWLNKSSRFMTAEKATQLRCTFLKPGDVLVARMPDPLGRACVFPGDRMPCVTVVDVCVIRLGEGVERRWLVHQLNAPSFRQQLGRFINGTTRQRVSRTNLGQLVVDAPPLPEQRRIADILDKADAVRRKRKEAIALTEELLRSAFLEMFGDPVANPKGLPIRHLLEVSKSIDYGVTASASQASVGPKFLRITDIQDNRVDWDVVPYCECAPAAAEAAELRSGDIVFARTGATTGKSFLIRSCPKSAVFASYLIRVRPGPTVLPDYLAGFFQSEAYWGQIRMMAEGAAQPGVNATKLGSLLVPVPSTQLQKQYVQCAMAVTENIRRQESAVTIGDDLLDSLVQRAFRGELGRA